MQDPHTALDEVAGIRKVNVCLHLLMIDLQQLKILLILKQFFEGGSSNEYLRGKHARADLSGREDLLEEIVIVSLVLTDSLEEVRRMFNENCEHALFREIL